MIKKYQVNASVAVEKKNRKNKTVITLIRDDKRTVLSELETWDGFSCNLVYNKNYVVVYSRGTMINQIPLNIEAVYSVKEDKFLNMNNKWLKVLFEYMFISRCSFDLAQVLTAINDNKLGLVEEEKENELIDYLTYKSEKVDKQDVKKYILACYPELKAYTNLSGPMTVIEYKKIDDGIDIYGFYFHVMPLDHIPPTLEVSPTNPSYTNYKQIYISEEEFLRRLRDDRI